MRRRKRKRRNRKIKKGEKTSGRISVHISCALAGLLRTALHNEAKEITMKVFVTLMAVVALSILLQSEQVTADKWSRKLLQARSRCSRLRKSPGGKRKSNQGGA